MAVFRAFLIAVVAMMSSAALGAERPSFTAMGVGKATAKPDLVYVDVGFSSKGKTPELAIKADADTVRRVTKAFIDAGVEGRDLQTSNYTIEEDMGPDGCGQDHEGQPFVSCVVQGYEIKNRMTLRIRELAKYGKVLGAAIAAGLRDISQITLGVSDEKPFQEEAYAQALLAAKDKAELTAKTLGFRLGPITDVGANFQQPYSEPGALTLASGLTYQGGDGEAADLAVVSDIQPGEIVFQRSASVTYEIVEER